MNCKFIDVNIGFYYNQLVGGIAAPLNIWYGKIELMFQTNNQI